jgi:hypothetical protein
MTLVQNVYVLAYLMHGLFQHLPTVNSLQQMRIALSTVARSRQLGPMKQFYVSSWHGFEDAFCVAVRSYKDCM